MIDLDKIKHCCDEIADVTIGALGDYSWSYVCELLNEILDEVGYKRNEYKEDENNDT